MASENQLRQKEEARREAIENTFDVNTTGMKKKEDQYCNQIDNE